MSVDFSKLPAGIKYSGDKDPDPKIWGMLFNPQRIKAVMTHHLQDKPHPQSPNVEVHSLLHVIVETQLAKKSPSQMVAAYKRLIDGGIKRHDAIHALCSVVAFHYADMEQGTMVGEADYQRALNEMTPEVWKRMNANAPKPAVGASKPAAPAPKAPAKK